MNYYTTGKIMERGPIAEGQSSNGNKWQRMTLVLEVPVGNYSKKIALQVMTRDIADVMSFNLGDRVEVSWDVSSREYTNPQGKTSWFTQVELRGIKPAEVADTAPAVQSVPMAGPGDDMDNDLPF